MAGPVYILDGLEHVEGHIRAPDILDAGFMVTEQGAESRSARDRAKRVKINDFIIIQ